MPYLFALLLVVNIVALGYFLFLNDTKVETPTMQEAKSELVTKVDISNAKQPSSD